MNFDKRCPISSLFIVILLAITSVVCRRYFLHSSFFSSLLKFESQIFIPSFEKLSNLHNDLEDDEEMVSAAQVGNMFVDWTDPQKVMYVQNLYLTSTTDLEFLAEICKVKITTTTFTSTWLAT